MNLVRSGGHIDPVEVTASNLPTGVTVTPLAILGNESSGTLTLSATDNASLGSTTVTVDGTAGTLEDSAQLMLTVVDAPQLSVSVAASGLNVPWDLEFAPDGSLFITERGGTMKRLQNGTVTPLSFDSTPAFRVEGEAGLMGLALHPDFPTTPRPVPVLQLQRRWQRRQEPGVPLPAQRNPARR